MPKDIARPDATSRPGPFEVLDARHVVEAPAGHRVMFSAVAAGDEAGDGQAMRAPLARVQRTLPGIA